MRSGSAPEPAPWSALAGLGLAAAVLTLIGLGDLPLRDFDEATVARRSRTIGYGIDARQQRFPDETPYRYQPFAEGSETYRWNDAARAALKDYNLDDLSI